MKDVDFRTKEQKIADFKNWCKVKWNNIRSFTWPLYRAEAAFES